MRHFWDLVQNDPVFLRKLNGWLTIFWTWNFPPVIALYLLVDNDTFQKICLLYLALVSIWANVGSHWSAWQAARIEAKQEADADVQEVLREVRLLRAELSDHGGWPGPQVPAEQDQASADEQQQPPGDP